MGLFEHGTRSVASLSLVVWLSGCAQPPADRLSQAQQLMDSAKAAGAPDYAMEQWAQLVVAFDRAKEEMARQERGPAIVRSYGKADEMLKRVVQDAAQVGALAAEKRAEAKAAAERTEHEARDAVASAQELLVLVSSKGNRAATKAISVELTSFDVSLNAVHRLIEEGNFVSAQSQAHMLRDQADAVTKKLHETTRGRIRRVGG